MCLSCWDLKGGCLERGLPLGCCGRACPCPRQDGTGLPSAGGTGRRLGGLIGANEQEMACLQEKVARSWWWGDLLERGYVQ